MSLQQESGFSNHRDLPKAIRGIWNISESQQGAFPKSSTYLSKVPFLGLPESPSFWNISIWNVFFRKKSRHIFCHTSHLFNPKRGRKDHSGSRWKTTLFCFDDNPIPSMYGIFTYIWLFLMIKGLKQEVMLRITGTPWNEQQKPLKTGHLHRKVINLPTINFQVLLLLVSGRVAANEIDRIQMSLLCFFCGEKAFPQNVGDIQFLFGKNHLGMEWMNHGSDVSEYVCLVTLLLGCPAGI